MKYFAFILQIIVISLSGVMLPGPMTAVAVEKGSKSPHAGLFFAIGHGIIEIPLILVFFFGLSYFFKIPIIRLIISFMGSVFLLIIAISMFKNAFKKEFMQNKKTTSSSIFLGIILSIGNPLFIIWWATIGVLLIMETVQFGYFGLIFFIIIHLSCDFIWYYFLSVMSFMGGKFFGQIFQRIIFSICGLILLIFVAVFIYNGIKIIF